MSTSTDGFDELFHESNAKEPRKRRGVTAVVLIVLAILLVAFVVWADGAARAAAEDMVESELEDRLPAGAGPTEATIGGFAFLPQFFSGSLDELDVTFAVGGDSIPALAGADGPAGALQISGGELTYEGAVSFLGVELGYVVNLEPTVDGGAIVLTPSAVEATTGAASVDLGQLVDLDALTFRVCAASLMPESMTLDSVDVRGSKLHFTVSGQDVPVNLDELRKRGSCE